MEKAFLITENTNLNQNFSEYDRLYFGDQYCEHNLFYFLDDEKFLSDLFALKIKLTLTISLLSEKSFKKIISFFEKYNIEDSLIDEIVVNDYGVLHFLKGKYSGIEIILGNFLCGQNKDPYLKIFKDKKTHTKISIDNKYYKKFNDINKIKRIEMYNVFQGIDIEESFDVNIYFPYVIYSINRYCVTSLIDKKINYLTVVEDCKGCKSIKNDSLNMNLKIGDSNVENYFRGNKQFYVNDNLNKNDKIKRIIFNNDLI